MTVWNYILTFMAGQLTGTAVAFAILFWPHRRRIKEDGEL